MKSILITLISILLITVPVSAKVGTLLLTNGNMVEGNIDILYNGSCWVNSNSVFMKFEKYEIEKISFSKRKKRKELSTKYDNLIYNAARDYGLDPALIKAVIKVESNFNKYEKSHKGACGLMQLMPDTARGLGVKRIFSPEENIDAGVRYLKKMLYTFDGDLEHALAAYNAGPNAVIRHNGVPPYKETIRYIKKVYKNYYNFYNTDEIYVFTDESGCMNVYNVR